MRIHLSETQPLDGTYKWVNSIALLDGTVLDSEARIMVCDNFVSSFEENEVADAIKKIVSKIRLKGQITFIEADIEVLSRKMFTQEIDLKDLNAIVFANQKRRCFLTMEKLLESLPSNITLESKHFDQATSRVIIKCRRTG